MTDFTFKMYAACEPHSRWAVNRSGPEPSCTWHSFFDRKEPIEMEGKLTCPECGENITYEKWAE